MATRVEVRGAGAPQNETEHDRPRVAGAASALDATAGTFQVNIGRAHDFTPGRAFVNVVTSSATVYRADAGTTQTQAAFFAALATTPNVIVEGSYDASTNTLTAATVGIVDPTKDRGWERGHGHFRDERGRGGWGNDALRGRNDD
jgi:hypothetical protein